MEIWDAFDENGKKLGVDLIRGEAIPKGMVLQRFLSCIRMVRSCS